ncbi:MAG TPA: HU family DNA-binding protein [Sphingomonas sp.]|jgi:nucleoid DNA-binding protein
MTHLELVARVAEAEQLDEKDVRRVLDAAFDAIVEEVAKDDKVVVGGFGTFKRGLKRRGPKQAKDVARKGKLVLTPSSTIDGKLNG